MILLADAILELFQNSLVLMRLNKSPTHLSKKVETK